MKQRFLIILLAAVLAVPLSLQASARDYKVTFSHDRAGKVIDKLQKATGYEVVCRKEVINSIPREANGVYTAKSLNALLDEVAGGILGLDYEIVEKTIILRQPSGKTARHSKEPSGTVIDENGEPLVGATVQVEGTTLGCATDIDGRFSIRKPDTDRFALIVRYVGMKPMKVDVSPATRFPLTIPMEQSVSLMDEVVVTGYQNLKRESATGAFTVISSEELEKRHAANIVNNLEGSIPGLVKNQKSRYGEGEDLLTIRGTGTFNARTAPLVVVDGLPIEGGLNSVNMYEVESVTVLKDASAAAIYGARASNGIIVITTKSAKKEKLSVDFNADLTITDKIDYSKGGLATAAQAIELERLNWDAMLADDDQSSLTSLLTNWGKGGFYAQGTSPVERLLIRNYLGEISDSELNSTLDQWSKNDYRKEWQDAVERQRVQQMYNISLRHQGKLVNSNIVFNYTHDNMGLKRDYNRSFSFRYKGDMKVTDWLDLDFSVNVLSSRSKTNMRGSFGDYNSYAPYMSMYNADGTLADMEADCILSNPALSNPDYELKDHTYNLIKDMGMSTSKERHTNIRAYLHANFKLPVKGWTASAQFQYEDISSKYQSLNMKDSYTMRNLYNLYTTVEKTEVWVDDPDWDFDDWDGDFDHIFKKPVMMDATIHNIPDGGMLSKSETTGTYYTFRAQTDYSHTFFDKHEITALAGFEFREMHTRGSSDCRFGYDPLTLTNQITQVNWAFLNGWGKSSILGDGYTAFGAYANFGDSNVLHRYYSYYFTLNYVFDRRYSLFGSYRVDKTDLFGSDPKFRGRPLWSVGASWNLQNETFMHDQTWLDVAKLRLSYGLTGNIDSNATSYLTASISSNSLNGAWQGSINTPPNDQLRWEKTATWNAGVDFAFLNYRINGSIDYYKKKGSDLLTEVALDCTTGVPGATQTLNAGCMENRGVELQLTGRILPQYARKDLGVSITANFAYNKNKVTRVFIHPTSGSSFRDLSLKEGYPLNTLTSIDYAGFVQEDKMIYGTWRDHKGEVHKTSLSSGEFEIEDVIVSGTTTPKWTGGFTPEISWNGFSLVGMFSFYGGHVMRVSPQIWSTTYDYDGSCPASALDYWKGKEGALPNGYRTKYLKNATIGASDYRNVEKANYLKFRSLALTYDFDSRLIRRFGVNNLRLRVQMDNLCTWVANSAGWDPEGITLSNGIPMKQPKSYTMSLYVNF